MAPLAMLVTNEALLEASSSGGRVTRTSAVAGCETAPYAFITTLRDSSGRRVFG